MNQFTVMLISKSIGRTGLKLLMNKDQTCQRCQVCAIHFSGTLKFRHFMSTVNLLDPKDCGNGDICCFVEQVQAELNRGAKSI